MANSGSAQRRPDRAHVDIQACCSSVRSGPSLNVLVDNIPDAPLPNRRYTINVRLPDVPCTRCTLQVIQMSNRCMDRCLMFARSLA